MMQDGLKTVPREEMQSYIARIQGPPSRGGSMHVHVPVDIVQFLNLRRNDLIEVAIRKPSIKETLQEYGIPNLKIRMPIAIKCPKCNQIGILNVGPYIRGYRGFTIRHHESRNYHYITSTEQKEFGLDVFRQLREKISLLLLRDAEKLSEGAMS